LKTEKTVVNVRRPKAGTEPPSYIQALNAIAITEGRARDFYLAWAETSPDPELQEVMRFVAVREIEHHWAFRKRIRELGYEFVDGPCKLCDEWHALFASDATDIEKFRGFGFDSPDTLPKDDFADFFNDLTLDPETGALLGRYVAEERDSATMFLHVYRRIVADTKTAKSNRKAKPANSRKKVAA
jgi:rubrerythrin